MGRLGFGELLVILGILLLFVGGKRLPQLGRSLGEAIREFQRSMKGNSSDQSNPPERKDPQ